MKTHQYQTIVAMLAIILGNVTTTLSVFWLVVGIIYATAAVFNLVFND